MQQNQSKLMQEASRIWDMNLDSFAFFKKLNNMYLNNN